jgi:hypothetical protein
MLPGFPPAHLQISRPFPSSSKFIIERKEGGKTSAVSSRPCRKLGSMKGHTHTRTHTHTEPTTREHGKNKEPPSQVETGEGVGRERRYGRVFSIQDVCVVCVSLCVYDFTTVTRKCPSHVPSLPQSICVYVSPFLPPVFIASMQQHVEAFPFLFDFRYCTSKKGRRQDIRHWLVKEIGGMKGHIYTHKTTHEKETNL